MACRRCRSLSLRVLALASRALWSVVFSMDVRVNAARRMPLCIAVAFEMNNVVFMHVELCKASDLVC